MFRFCVGCFVIKGKGRRGEKGEEKGRKDEEKREEMKEEEKFDYFYYLKYSGPIFLGMYLYR